MSKVHAKTHAREQIIKLLYTYEFVDDYQNISSDDKLANQYFNNIVEQLSKIDQLISRNLSKWDISQLNPVDLAILRLACYEIINTDLAPAIIVNEALELCKKYSSDQHKNFIHKTLDLIIKDYNESKTN